MLDKNKKYNSSLSCAIKEDSKGINCCGEEHNHDHNHDICSSSCSCSCGHSHDHNHESENLKSKSFIIGIVLFIIGILVSIFINESYLWIKLIIFFLAYILIGKEILRTSFRNILKGQIFDENFLMTVASIGAFLIGEYPEAVAVMLFYRIGEYVQGKAISHSKRSISELMDIRPDTANLKTEDGIVEVNAESINVGDVIVIKAGEKIPLDGQIIEGNSTIDTKALTGESLPQDVTVGSELLSGSINGQGLIYLKVEKKFKESTASKILELVENASNKKAKTENFITKFARYYTPFVVFVAIALAIIPPIVGMGEFSDWLYRALVFLVVSCPCALVISIPLGFFGGIGAASSMGILIKGGNYLEAINAVDTVIFDKTGTLTDGIFKVISIKNANGFTQEQVLEFGAYAENHSNHPIAVSIKNMYCQGNFNNWGKHVIDENKISNIEEHAGLGIKVNYDGKVILAGNSKLMSREKVKFEQADDIGSIVYIAVDGYFAGVIIIADEAKEDSKNVIQGLKKLGIKQTIMLTGDSKKIGNKIGNDLGIDKIYAELLPDEKVETLEHIYSTKDNSKGKIIFVGDGINDAPVLARADVGAAMGGVGSDAAIEAADLVIMNDEPTKIITAIKIARKTRKIVWQNIILALGVKLIVLILGAFGIATMWEAVFADVGVAIMAVLNSVRAGRIK
ncbi:heavy metal translocating P-type ATPase [Anaerovorax odorimutans]|uniref:heavy metal translocating P-type ATPase n=1 Tax=Anaerovorax odorimutans TaxID=109327 RepID=UPI000419EFE9|nr:heavy metal translocating P-type ATPase [Anaerovorax odorimutans]